MVLRDIHIWTTKWTKAPVAGFHGLYLYSTVSLSAIRIQKLLAAKLYLIGGAQSRLSCLRDANLACSRYHRILLTGMWPQSIFPIAPDDWIKCFRNSPSDQNSIQITLVHKLTVVASYSLDSRNYLTLACGRSHIHQNMIWSRSLDVATAHTWTAQIWSSAQEQYTRRLRFHIRSLDHALHCAVSVCMGRIRTPADSFAIIPLAVRNLKPQFGSGTPSIVIYCIDTAPISFNPNVHPIRSL